jgi:hypothetical protein
VVLIDAGPEKTAVVRVVEGRREEGGDIHDIEGMMSIC